MMKKIFKRNTYMTDEEVWLELQEYDELGYEDMPQYLKNELIGRRITFDRRNPTDSEMLETLEDAKEHRLMNNEMNIEDYKEKYHV